MKSVQLPDGSVGQFPDEMSDEQIGAVLSKQFPPSTPVAKRAAPADIPIDPNQGAAAPESIPQATILGDLTAGSRNWQTRMRRGVADTGEILGGPILKKALAFMNPSDEDVASAAQAVKQGGPIANITQMAGDIGANMLAAPYRAVQGTATAIKGLPAALEALEALKTTGPALKQALYSTAVVPKEDKAVAATAGGIAPTIAPTVAGLLTGPLKRLITPEAKVLQEAGVDITPSVAISGNDQGTIPGFISGAVRALRDKAAWVPGMGDVITSRNNKMLSQGAVAKVNEVLKPLGQSLDTNLPPQQALDTAEELIDRAYQAAKPSISVSPLAPVIHPMPIGSREPGVPQGVIPPGNPRAFFYDIIQHFDDEVPHIDERGIKLMRDTVDKLIFKPLTFAAQNGTSVNGADWKAVDSALNKLSDDALAKSTDPASVALGKGFKALQDGWYHVAQESTPGAKAAIRQADEAFSRLQPVAKAAESVMSGPWTPKRMHVVNTRAGIEPSELDQALNATLGDLHYKHTSASGANSTGMAAAKMAGLAGVGDVASVAGLHGAPGFTTVLPFLAGAAAGTYGLGSKPAMAYLQHGVNPALEKANSVINLLRSNPKSYDEAMMDQFLRNMTQQSIAAEGKR